MTSKELIMFIKNNNAENMCVVVQFRDNGGEYIGGEEVKDVCFGECTLRYDGSFYIDYKSNKPNNIIL